MLDSGAAGTSLAGKPQVLTLQKRDPTIQLNILTAGSNKIRFGKGTITVKGIIQVFTPLGTIAFYIVLINIPFLLCL